MNPEKTPLVNKLTLLVLCLILVCLVLLVGRAYQKQPPAGDTPAVAEVEATPAPAEEPSLVTAPAPVKPIQPRRAPVTNGTRASLPTPPQPANAPAPAEPAPVQYVESPAAFANAFETEYANTPVTASAPLGSGASLSGWVTLTGTPKPEIPIPMTPTCSALHPGKATTRHFIVSPEGGLANVLVYVSNARPASPLVDPPLLDQVGCMFEPYVLGVVMGQKFRVRNSDSELHNIHATPRSNREFNIAQGQRGQVDQFSFPKPELFVRLKCDVHPWMFAYVNVMPHPFFSISDTNGAFRIPAGLAPGDYTISAVHLKAGGLTRQITLGDGEPRPLHFQFSVPVGAQPQGGVVRPN